MDGLTRGNLGANLAGPDVRITALAGARGTIGSL